MLPHVRRVMIRMRPVAHVAHRRVVVDFGARRGDWLGGLRLCWHSGLHHVLLLQEALALIGLPQIVKVSALVYFLYNTIQRTFESRGLKFVGLDQLW